MIARAAARPAVVGSAVIWDDDIQAAAEYAIRYRKKLPSDRWTDGVIGAEAVARGIEKLAYELAGRVVADYEAGLMSMSLGEPEYPVK